MAYCRKCGEKLENGKKFCAECGAPVDYIPSYSTAPMRQESISKKRKKPLFKRWWVWALLLVLVLSLWNRAGGHTNRTNSVSRSSRSVPILTTAPDSTPKPSTMPTEPTEKEDPSEEAESEATLEPEAKPEPTEAPLSQADIRPEFKEYMDSYEEFMDEYIAFMEKYEDADSADALMLYDYYRLMDRYMEFTEKLESMEESDYTNAEWAYYLEVTNRVNVKLLRSLD